VHSVHRVKVRGGKRACLLLAITAVLLVGSAFPATGLARFQAARAGSSYEQGLSEAGIEPYSRDPTDSKPYAVCPAPTAAQLTCMSAVVPEALAARELATKAGPRLDGSGELGGFSPADLRSAYNLPSQGGASLTIAITVAYDYPTAASDLALYRETYGLPPCTSASGCFKKVNQEGKVSDYPQADSGWAAEAALDLDMASAICPECKLLLVEADDNRYESLPRAVETAAKLGADVISNSWGGEEFSGEEAFDSYLHHPGIPILFASGDAGFGAEYPAASPEVIAVGGTSLRSDGGARSWAESAWIGAGSGCSEYEAKPAWQTDDGCDGRTIADVAAIADPQTPVSVYDSYGGYGGWLLFGGTSASTPLMAGVEALSSSAERNAGAARFWEQGVEGRLFDVTEGRNGHCEPPATYLCRAKPGYDGPTGWGTPGGSRPGPPIVATEDAADVTVDEVTLRGTVDPNGSATSFHFEYGPTLSYGTSVPIAAGDAGAGIEPQEVEQLVTGLTQSSAYHYRVVATNGFGTSYGGDHAWVASDWSPQAVPTGDTREELFGVSCGGPSSCSAIGSQAVYFEGSFYNDAPVAQRWDGGGWTRESPPVEHSPASGYASRLEDVSCSSPDNCVAIGENYEIAPGYMPLGEKWDGSQWSLLEVAVPAEAVPGPNGQYEVRMHGVSCASAVACVAVGGATTDWSSGEVQGLIEVWNGQEWTYQLLPGPPGWKENYLWGVSCVSAASCVAVGETRSGSSRKPLVARLDGTKWSREASASPAGGLQAVSCDSAHSCMAVGGTDGEFGGDGLAEEWDGTTWTALPLDKPMRGVSCLAADSCVAVGGEHRLEALPEAFGVRWNGSEWTAEDPVLPADASDNAMELYDVDCATSGCTAVGWYWSWGYRPLAERLPLASGPAAPGAFAKSALATAHQATLRATVFPKGLATTYQFEYGNSTGYGSNVPVPAADVGSGSDGVDVDETIGGLEPASTYHFRIVAVSAAGTTRSADRTLVTPPEPPVVLTASGGSEITTESATVTGSVNPSSAKVTNCHFEYGPDSSYGKSSPCNPSSPGAGSEPVKVSAALTGLIPDTAYHFRVMATNAGGTSHGDDEEFSTLAESPPAPTVLTVPGASGISETTATVAGIVNPNSHLVTDCHIEYGPAASYGKSVSCSPFSPGAGSEPVDVSAVLTGLSPGTGYHFRVVATSAGGTTYGGGQVFATAARTQALDPGPAQIQGPRAALGRVYRDCAERARGDYRRARKGAMRKHGSSRSAALRRANRHKRQALEQCIARIDALL
jgi:hypothetical protein